LWGGGRWFGLDVWRRWPVSLEVACVVAIGCMYQVRK
jgi:hypothetical protein